MQGSKSIISKQAEIHESAKIGQNVTIGPWAFVGENVEVGDGSIIESHAIIRKNTKLGKNNRIHSYAVLGGDPQHLKYQGEESWLVVGDNNCFREGVTINRGSHLDQQTTFVGNNNNFFAGSHVGHDTKIGNNVTFVNNAVVAGHAQIDDYAMLGAHCSVHQFTRVGAWSFATHLAQVAKDLPPYMIAVSDPVMILGLNLVALRRQGFSGKTLLGLKSAFKIMYQKMLPLESLKIELKLLSLDIPEVNLILDLIDNSKRGFIRKASFRKGERFES